VDVPSLLTPISSRRKHRRDRVQQKTDSSIAAQLGPATDRLSGRGPKGQQIRRRLIEESSAWEEISDLSTNSTTCGIVPEALYNRFLLRSLASYCNDSDATMQRLCARVTTRSIILHAKDQGDSADQSVYRHAALFTWKPRVERRSRARAEGSLASRSEIGSAWRPGRPRRFHFRPASPAARPSRISLSTLARLDCCIVKPCVNHSRQIFLHSPEMVLQQQRHNHAHVRAVRRRCTMIRGKHQETPCAIAPSTNSAVPMRGCFAIWSYV
jgi:hypothetical protein